MTNESIGRWVSIIHRYGHIYITKKLEPYKIGKGQFLFLLALYRKDGLLQEELSHYLYMDKGTTARAIGKLEQEGYIKRIEDEKDRRANRVYLTDKGKEFQPLLYSIIEDWTIILNEGFSDEETERMFSFLTRMADNAAKYVKNRE